MVTNIEITEIASLDEMLLNFNLVKQLTASLTESRYHTYLSEMVPHNYFQVIARYENEIVGVSGYWIATKLYCGKYLEIDNFVVDEKYRSQQIGYLLIKKLEEIAQRHHCDVMMLDAYLQNTEAHKFYEKHAFKAKGYHFIKKVSSIESSTNA